MKRLTGVLIGLLTVFATFCGAYGANAAIADAYIDNGRLVIEYQAGMSDTAVAAYYSGRTLCGAYLAETDGEAYTFDIPAGYTKIRVWFTDEDETRTVQIIDRTASRDKGISAATPRPMPPTVSVPESPVQSEEPLEEYDEGYGGFLELPNKTGPSEPPAEPSDSEDENIQTFTFSVDCGRALSSDKLSDELSGSLPPDGIIAPASEYKLTEDMTVYDALMAAADEYGFTVEYNSGYVSGINGLYEFDCGPLSGWMYIVNGEVILAPVDMYKIHDGDIVQMAYTVSLGSDLGQDVE